MYRDFLYMDSERIQSIIAQLNEGVLKEIITEQSKEISGKLGATASLLVNLISANLEGTAKRASNLHSSKVLHDYAFNIALDSLKNNDLILMEKEINQSNIFVPDVAFVLVHGIASIRDYGIAYDMLGNQSLLDMIQGSNNTIQSQNMNRQQRRATGQPNVATNSNLQVMEQIRSFIGDFMKDSLHVNIKIPNGTTFIGPMSRGYLREETRSFIFKYGGEAQDGWYMLAQISSAPSSVDKLQKFQDFIKNFNASNSNNGTIIDMFQPIIEMVYGLQEAVASVSYPSIAVTPIAVYRELNTFK